MSCIYFWSTYSRLWLTFYSITIWAIHWNWKKQKTKWNYINFNFFNLKKKKKKKNRFQHYAKGHGGVAKLQTHTDCWIYTATVRGGGGGGTGVLEIRTEKKGLVCFSFVFYFIIFYFFIFFFFLNSSVLSAGCGAVTTTRRCSTCMSAWGCPLFFLPWDGFFLVLPAPKRRQPLNMNTDTSSKKKERNIKREKGSYII